MATVGENSHVDESLVAQYVQDSCRSIEGHISQAEEELLGESGDIQARLEPSIHHIAVATSALFRHVKQWNTGPGEGNPLVDFIFALAQRTRKASLEYIRAAKASCSNRMDYMTREAHQIARQELQKLVKCASLLVETLQRQKAIGMPGTPAEVTMDEQVCRLVTLADKLATHTHEAVDLATRVGPLDMLRGSDSFFSTLGQLVEEVQCYAESSDVIQMSEKLRGYRNELIYLCQDAARAASGENVSPRTQSSLVQRRQATLQAILGSEVDLLVAFIFCQHSDAQDGRGKSKFDSEIGYEVPSPPVRRNRVQTDVETRMTGPKRPQRPRTCRVPSEYLEQIRTEIGGTSERTAAHTITPAQAAKRQVKKAGSLKRPPKHRTLAAGETHKELIKPEESTAGKLNQRQQMAMEATMATAVPVVVALFSSRFAWFQKGWDRQPSGMKQQFMTEMKNELVKLRWYDDSQRNEPAQYPLPRPASSFTAVSPALQKAEDKEENELQQIMVPASSPVRWFHRAVSMSNVLDGNSVKELHGFQEHIPQRVHFMCDLVSQHLQSCLWDGEKPSVATDDIGRNLSKVAVELYQLFNKLVSVSSPGSSNEIVHQMALPVTEAIVSAGTQGQEDNTLLEVLRESNSFSTIQEVSQHLLLHIREKLLSLRALGFQTVCIVRSVQDQSEQRISHASTLQLIAIARRVVATIESVLHQMATSEYIRLNFTRDRLAGRFSSNLRQTVKKDVPYWSYTPDEQETANMGSLNHLIFCLTGSMDDLPSGYENAFLNLYETFCGSKTLFGKLFERYQVPEKSEYSSGATRQLRIRITELICNWIQRKYQDIDLETIAAIEKFSQVQLVQDGFNQEATAIKSLLAKKLEESNRDLRENFQSIPPLVWHSNSSESLYRYFLDADETLIAQQLTIHDWNIFRRIQHSELIGQAWNKRKHCASNVLDHIQRLNHVSYWVPSLLLWSEKLKERGNVLWKFVRIGQELLKLGNYNTLMGIVAGLNMSAVLRLKFTLMVLSDDQTQQMEELVALMSPFKAYKVYREHMAEASLPIIPYLGVYLTDLTFIEEGNPDNSKGFIFFAKRLRVSRVLEQIEHYQSSPYNLVPCEPVFSYLQELPGLDDDALYQLSLIREPRESVITDIL